METAATTHVPDVETDDEETPAWTLFLASVVFSVFAVIPFTSYWAQISDPTEVGRRYRGVARLFELVGPVPVTVVFGLLALTMLAVAVNKVRKRFS